MKVCHTYIDTAGSHIVPTKRPRRTKLTFLDIRFSSFYKDQGLRIIPGKRRGVLNHRKSGAYVAGMVNRYKAGAHSSNRNRT